MNKSIIRPCRPTTHLLYQHGFRSSPLSAKAQQMLAWLQAQRPQVHWWCPQLPPSPRKEIAGDGVVFDNQYVPHKTGSEKFESKYQHTSLGEFSGK